MGDYIIGKEQKKLIDYFLKQKDKAWQKSTRKRLMKTSTSYEWKVFKALPEWLRKNAKRQRVFHHDGHTYFFDIYLPCAKVAIEVDGGYHKAQRGKDMFRDQLVSRYGIKTFRIANEVVKNEVRLQLFVRMIESYCLSKRL